jgi:hypothetical protein
MPVGVPALSAPAEAQLALPIGGDRFAERNDVGGPPCRQPQTVPVPLGDGAVVGGSDSRYGPALVVNDGYHEHAAIVSDEAVDSAGVRDLSAAGRF